MEQRNYNQLAGDFLQGQQFSVVPDANASSIAPSMSQTGSQMILPATQDNISTTGSQQAASQGDFDVQLLLNNLFSELHVSFRGLPRSSHREELVQCLEEKARGHFSNTELDFLLKILTSNGRIDASPVFTQIRVQQNSKVEAAQILGLLPSERLWQIMVEEHHRRDFQTTAPLCREIALRGLRGGTAGSPKAPDFEEFGPITHTAIRSLEAGAEKRRQHSVQFAGTGPSFATASRTCTSVATQESQSPSTRSGKYPPMSLP